MISMIRRAILAYRVQEQERRIEIAREWRRYYEAMEADAAEKQRIACNELAHLRQLANLDRMGRGARA